METPTQTQIAKTIPNCFFFKRTLGITILNFKLYSKAIVMKIYGIDTERYTSNNGIELKPQKYIQTPMNFWFLVKNPEIHTGKRQHL